MTMVNAPFYSENRALGSSTPAKRIVLNFASRDTLPAALLVTVQTKAGVRKRVEFAVQHRINTTSENVYT